MAPVSAAVMQLQVRRPLPLSVLLGVLLDAHILGIEMPQERVIRTLLADFDSWQVRDSLTALTSRFTIVRNSFKQFLDGAATAYTCIRTLRIYRFVVSSMML